MLGKYNTHVWEYISQKLGMIKWRYVDLCPLWKCNAKCPTCGAWKRGNNMLSPEQAEKIICDTVFKHLEYMVIEGGEPTLWPELGWFVKMNCDMFPKRTVAVITNGFLPRKVKVLAEAWLPVKNQIRWVISLNGIGAVHDKSRGVDGVFQKTVTTAAMLKDMGYIITFSFVPFQYNESDYEKVKAYGEMLGIPVDVCFPCESGKFGPPPEWKPADFDRIEEITKDSTRGFWAKKIVEYFFRHAEKKELMPCFAGSAMIHINPEGIIRPCSMDERMEIGQIKDDKVKVNTHKLKEYLTEWIPQKCEYQHGGVCNRCFITWTMRRSIPELLKWRLSR